MNLRLLITILLFSIGLNTYAQVTTTSSNNINCTTPTSTLTASLIGDTPHDAGITTDDEYSGGIINIGFTFNFYGVNYSKCLIGPNGLICFDTTLVGSFEDWDIITSGALLGNANVLNCICGPYCDMDFADFGGTCTYSTDGTAPYRKFSVTFCKDYMYNTSYCPRQFTTSQIIIYETTNIAEVHIAHKTVCTAWNGGYAIVGVENAAGTAATAAPGRDYPTTWSATDEGWRFTPSASGASYTCTSIPYAPIPFASSAIYWFDSSTDTYLGTGSTLSVSPTVTTTYKAGAVGCADTSFSFVTVISSGFITDSISFSASATLSGTAGPTTCLGSDGYITIAGLTAGMTDVINYQLGGVAQPPVTATVSAAGTIELTGLTAGVYTNIIVTQGSCITAPLSVTLNPAPITITIVSTSNPSYCGATDGTIVLSGLTPSTTYSVSYDTTGVTVGPITLTSTSAGFITITGLSAFGGSTIYSNISATGGPCPGNSVGPVTLRNPPPPIVTVDSPVVNTCVGVTTMLHAYATPTGLPYSYIWSPGTDLNSTTIYNPSVTPVAGGDVYYVVSVNPSTDPTCATTANIDVHTIPNTFTIHPTDTMICQGKTLQVIGAGDPSFSYQWIPTAGIAVSNVLNAFITPDTSAMYICTASYSLCPDIRDTLYLSVQPTPAVFISNNRVLCQYDTLHLMASVSPAWYSGYTYLWSPATNLDNSTSATVVFSGSASTTLYATVTTPAGCSSVDSVAITVYPGNFATLSPGNEGFCPHQSAELIPVAPSGTTYHWYPAMYLSDSLGSAPFISPITSQVYTVIATSINGCKDTLNFTATVFPAAVIGINSDSVTLYPGESFEIQTMSNCTTFAWFPPTGLSDPNVSNPTASPSISTKFVVNGTTENGCVTTDSIDILVDPTALLATPNAFNPGGTTNSEFKIFQRGVVSINYFRIFDRWGELLFETNDLSQGWDGNYKGKPQPFGVYIYEIQAVTAEGAIFSKHGNITLLR